MNSDELILKNEPKRNFIHEIIDRDKEAGASAVVTRFPPEPNGYLHIGHAKSICLNFGLAKEYSGRCHLRFDDTNPSKENTEYIESIKEDIKWLGFDWSEHLYFASNYFDKLYEWAKALIRAGKAYVCDLPPEEVSKTRGTLTEPGTESPYRNRSIDENLDLFERMKSGEFPDGSKTLRAKIDMKSSFMVLRDPVMYRILRVTHHRTGDKWCIYPTYDWTHGQSDWNEGITHSICTLEFENNRALYDWFLRTLESLGVETGSKRLPKQIEFARLNLTHTVMSKRWLLELVERGVVDGWDDPRMPTLAGLRRRGFTPESIRDFCERIGVAKTNSIVELVLLEHCARQDLNRRAERRMAVLKPLKITLTNYPEDKIDKFEVKNNPDDESAGTRNLIFSREIFIEEDDFRENPPKHFFRLMPGGEVRLKDAYIIKCNEAVKDSSGKIVELLCTVDPDSRGGQSASGKKVKSTLHWVSAKYSESAEARLYNPLFLTPNPYDFPKGQDLLFNLNSDSMEILKDCRIEKELASAKPGESYQFMRLGYFCVDSRNCVPGHLVFNQTVTLKDDLARVEKKK